MITYATFDDLFELDELAERVITHMKELKIPQWELSYPRYEHFEKDVISNALILYKENEEILGCMAILPENDPPYRTISSWQKEYSIVIHRVLVDPCAQNKGIAKQLQDYAIQLGNQKGNETIKI